MTMVREAQETFLENCPRSTRYVRMRNYYSNFFISAGGFSRVRLTNFEKMIDKQNDRLNEIHRIYLLDLQRQ